MKNVAIVNSDSIGDMVCLKKEIMNLKKTIAHLKIKCESRGDLDAMNETQASLRLDPKRRKMMFVNPYGSSGDLFESQEDQSFHRETRRIGRRIISDNYFINEDSESSRSNTSSSKDLFNNQDDH